MTGASGPQGRLRVEVRVSPRAPRTSVGGRRGDALVVRVTAPAVGGRATEAALRALADALGLRRGAVALVTGATSRDKLVELTGDRDRLACQVRRLLDA